MKALRDAGDETPERRFLKDAATVWAEIPLDRRTKALAALALPYDASTVSLRLAKRAGVPATLDNVLVIFAGDERGPATRAIAPSGAATPTPSARAEPQRLPPPPAAEPVFVAQRVAVPAGSKPVEAPPATKSAPAPARAAPAAAAALAPAAPLAAPLAAPAPPSAAPPAAPAPQAMPAAAAATQPTTAATEALPDGPDEAEADRKGKKAKKAKKAKKDKSAPELADGMPETGDPKKKGMLSGLFAKKPTEAAPAPLVTNVTEVPPLTDPDLTEVQVYPVQEGYAFIRIVHDKKHHEHIYEVIEPVLSERERNVLDFVQNTLTDVLDVGPSTMKKDEAATLIRKHVDEILYDYSINLTPLAKEKILYFSLRDFLGFGRLDPIMRDDLIEDVSCDGPHQPIFIYHRKYESLRSSVQFRDHAELDSYVIRMAQRSGKHISIAEPLLDATLPDGSRLNATLSDEVTAYGSTFTIRKFRDDPFTPPDLV
ncbi:MAG: hypothetical protein ACYDCK_09930, partial [Thermoplasmatota archaeon]